MSPKFFIKLLFIFIAITNSRLTATPGSQVIGKVVDERTQNPVVWVNVFLANTTLGCASSDKGNFEINNIPQGVYHLVFQHIGYEIKVIKLNCLHSNIRELNIALVPKILSGEKIQITAPQNKQWKKDLKIFQQEFLGKTENSKKCKIVNPEVLNFSANPAQKELIAMTDSLLLVNNYALGYHIRIVLDTFRLSAAEDHYYFSIYPHFIEMSPENEKEKQKWEKKRFETYLGSLKHFWKSLIADKTRENDFLLYRVDGLKNKSGTPIDSVDFLNKSYFDGMKEVNFSKYLRILYTDYRKSKLVTTGFSPYRQESYSQMNYPKSTIVFENTPVLINREGRCLTPDFIQVYGYFASQRVADLLPHEYSPNN